MKTGLLMGIGYELSGRVMSIGLNRDKTGLMGIGYGKTMGWRLDPNR